MSSQSNPLHIFLVTLFICDFSVTHNACAEEVVAMRDSDAVGQQQEEKEINSRNNEDKLDGSFNRSTAFNNESTVGATTTNTTTQLPTTKKQEEALPEKGSQEKEHKSSMAIFFILFIIVLSVLVVHILLVTKFHYVPESLAIVVLGAIIGFMLNFSDRDWTGNFFANIGSILVFACVGTAVSAFIIGGGIYILGQADLIFQLSAVESFAFGSMISAVDPVATLAIFQALSVDPILYMLVFGESMLNDAVAIVLTTTVLEMNAPEMKDIPTPQAVIISFGRFFVMFFGSAFLGIVAGLMSSLLLKHVELRKTPSLEFGIMLVFAYLPYGLAEGIHLSGIMAILFCGIVMSHYTHFNLSPITQITMQQTFRTLAFIAETCVFAYLGMAFFTFRLIFKPVFIIWAIILCLLGRAFNIFPLSLLVNFFREHRITKRMQFTMWFSGLRGAIAFALVLHMEFNDDITRRIMVTSTLTIVVFTIMILGGGTLPLINFLNKTHSGRKPKRRRRRSKRRSRKAGRSRSGTPLSLSKTQELGEAIEPDLTYSEYTTEVEEIGRQRTVNSSDQERKIALPSQLKGLARVDVTYLRPFFVRKFSQKEKKESTMKLADLALEWSQAVDEESGSAEEDVVVDFTRDTKNGPHLSSSAFSVKNLTPDSSDLENDKKPLIFNPDR